MAKDERNFNIPRGVDEESEAIRNALRQRIRDYEANMPRQDVASNNQVPHKQNQFQTTNANNYQSNVSQQNQNNPFVNRQINNQSSSFSSAGQQQNMSYQQYQQNLNQNQKNFNQDQQNFNQYQQNTNNNLQNQAGFQQNTFTGQQYTSPFAQPASNAAPFTGNNDFAKATHSTEPVIYKPKKRKSASKTFLLLFVLIAVIFLLSWSLREFVFQPYEIPSGSMEKTIMTGDMVFAEKLSYKFGSPQPGDIITFYDPLNPGRILIKRVIATAGQSIDIKENKLYIDGVEQHEDYVGLLPTTQLRSATVAYPYIVPEGQVWVMGDNRTNSQDSRYFGSIPVDSVIGQALVVYWPVSNAKNLK